MAMKVSWFGALDGAASCAGAPGALLWLKTCGMSLASRVATGPAGNRIPSDPGPTIGAIRATGRWPRWRRIDTRTSSC
jgi:hypothetical protein